MRAQNNDQDLDGDEMGAEKVSRRELIRDWPNLDAHKVHRLIEQTNPNSLCCTSKSKRPTGLNSLEDNDHLPLSRLKPLTSESRCPQSDHFYI